MVNETNQDIDTAINSINDGKHGVVRPQLLTPKRYVNNKCRKSPFFLHRKSFILIKIGYIVMPLKELDLDLVYENKIKQ